MLFKAPQFEKAEYPICSRFPGRVISSRFPQFANAKLSMIVTLSGMITVLTSLLLNALSLMIVMVSGMITVSAPVNPHRE